MADAQANGNDGFVPGALCIQLPGQVKLKVNILGSKSYLVLEFPDKTRVVYHYLDQISVIEKSDGSRTTSFPTGETVETNNNVESD